MVTTESIPLLHQTTAEGYQELLQLVHLLANLTTLVGIPHHHALLGVIHQEDGGFDVETFLDGFLPALEGFVLHQLEAMTMIHQGIACNASSRLVGLREATIDDQQFAIGLDGFLALDGAHRHMTIDDM